MQKPRGFPFGPMFPALLLALAPLVAVRAYNANDIIGGIAGNAGVGYSGDGGPAVNAELNAPRAVAFDATGAWMYIGDVGSHVVRRVSMKTGLISTVAGTGTAGYNGDNIPATTAQLNSPYALAVDGAGSLYIADAGNNRIRKVSPTGTITTLAGTGAAGCNNGSGDPTTATLNSPGGLTFDSAGNLLIADTGNYVVRKIDGCGTISTFAGSCGFAAYQPNGMAADDAGNVNVAVANKNVVLKVSATGTPTVFAGSGSAGYAGDGSAANAANVMLNFPYTVARDAAGDIYIGDSSNHVVRVVTPDNVIHTAAGNGTSGNSGDGGIATSAELNFTFGVGASPAGVWVVVDGSSSPVVRAVGPAATLFVRVAGNGLYDDAVESAEGRIYCSQCGANYVQDTPVILTGLFPQRSESLYEWTGNCHASGSQCTVLPRGITNVVAHFSPWYIRTIAGRGATSAQLAQPFGLALGTNGDLYISETGDCVVRKLSENGALTTVAGNGFCGDTGDGTATTKELKDPQGIALDSVGNLYVQDSGNSKLRKITPDGVLHTISTDIVSTAGPALVVDASDTVYVVGAGDTILKVTPDGTESTFAFLYLGDGPANGLSLEKSGELIVGLGGGGLSYLYAVVPPDLINLGYPASRAPVTPNYGFAAIDRASIFLAANCGLFYSDSRVILGGPFAPIDPEDCSGYSDGPTYAVVTPVGGVIGIVAAAPTRAYLADYGNNAVRLLYPDAIFTGDMDE